MKQKERHFKRKKVFVGKRRKLTTGKKVVTELIVFKTDFKCTNFVLYKYT